ncbi:unnamed protein product, partial [Musa textilis]
GASPNRASHTTRSTPFRHMDRRRRRRRPSVPIAESLPRAFLPGVECALPPSLRRSRLHPRPPAAHGAPVHGIPHSRRPLRRPRPPWQRHRLRQRCPLPPPRLPPPRQLLPGPRHSHHRPPRPLNAPLSRLPPLPHPRSQASPGPLTASLRSFSCDASLRHLTGVWLSRFQNLTDLSVVGVPVSASGPAVILSQMHHLRSATISATNLSGVVPRHWNALGLVHLNLSSNLLNGRIPSSISVLGFIQTLDLSSNALTGSLPDTIGDLAALKHASFARNSLSGPIPDSISQLSALVHLDLSSNQFNGSIPKFLAEMKGLKLLNLENNNFQGVFPFNASFLRRFEVFKVGGNNNLCYNHTQLSSSLKLGIAPCDRYGLPVSPPADRSTRADSSDYSDDSSDEGSRDAGSNGASHHGPSKLVLGVAIGLSCFVFLVIFLVCFSKQLFTSHSRITVASFSRRKKSFCRS